MKWVQQLSPTGLSGRQQGKAPVSLPPATATHGGTQLTVMFVGHTRAIQFQGHSITVLVQLSLPSLRYSWAATEGSGFNSSTQGAGGRQAGRSELLEAWWVPSGSVRMVFDIQSHTDEDQEGPRG